MTPEVLRHFFNRNREFDNSRKEKEPIELETDEVYDTYGEILIGVLVLFLVCSYTI